MDNNLENNYYENDFLQNNIHNISSKDISSPLKIKKVGEMIETNNNIECTALHNEKNKKTCKNKEKHNKEHNSCNLDTKNYPTQTESGQLIANIKEQSEVVDRNITIINSSDADSLISTDNHKKIHSHSHNDDSSFKFDIKMLLNSSFRLMKNHDEFFYLVIFLSIWLCLILAELIYGVAQAKVHIISDSFFNLFKSISIFITVFSILFTRVFHFNSVFLKNRIELIAALSNIIFLLIVSLYMCLQALHIITETNDGDMPEHSHDHGHDSDEAGTINFFKNFFIFKIIVDVVIILNLSDYIIHPSIQIKLLLWKKNHSWKNLDEFNLDNLKESKNLIKIWNNHFENMNALIINMSSDLFSSIFFLIWFYVSTDQHFEYAYCFISVINLILVIIFINPVLNSVFRILMQGKTEVYESFYQKLQNEISYYEGCLGMKEMKIWMTAQNDIKCNIFINK